MTEGKKGIGKTKLGLLALTVVAVVLTISNLWVYASLSNQIEDLETDNDDLNIQVNTLQTDKTSLEDQVTNLQTDKGKLQSEVNTLKTEKSQLQSQIDTLEDEKGQLQSQVDSLETLKSQLQSQVNTLKTEKNQMQSQIDSLEAQIDSLETQIVSLEAQIGDLEAQVSDLEYQIFLLEEAQLHRVGVYWNDNHPLFGSPYVNIYGCIFNSGTNDAYSVVYTVRIYDEYDTLLKTEEIHLGDISGKSYESFDIDVEYSGDADYVTTTLDYW